MEDKGEGETDFTVIETASDTLDSSIKFHLVTDILGFILFMHQQIPSLLQDLTLEFDELNTEFAELETAIVQAETCSLRRNHASRKREVRMGIRRLDKLMNTISSLRTALQLMITEFPAIQRVILILGSSPLRPLNVYELNFSCESAASGGEFTRNRVVETLSKKAIRVLVSKGAGSSSSVGINWRLLSIRYMLYVKGFSVGILSKAWLPGHPQPKSERSFEGERCCAVASSRSSGTTLTLFIDHSNAMFRRR
ncbi:uncharacterized protein LOC107029708 isoform X3 [Solanum pennellii]|uniref:Uncharacterized protein LOC107029708 isoform X3 n=1 Tax=Solanum pennellii TaxID=28526 RepID=A0ABM1VHR5_SOLPN|nr:uncharacterized protein LOC107029708 isoform X3 [Solanum pennellii]